MPLCHPNPPPCIKIISEDKTFSYRNICRYHHYFTTRSFWNFCSLYVFLVYLQISDRLQCNLGQLKESKKKNNNYNNFHRTEDLSNLKFCCSVGLLFSRIQSIFFFTIHWGSCLLLWLVLCPGSRGATMEPSQIPNSC